MNLEYLARVVFNTNNILYPDTVFGTDSHTTMIDGLGVAGWGVGGIEAEAAMLGQVRSSTWVNLNNATEYERKVYNLHTGYEHGSSGCSWV